MLLPHHSFQIHVEWLQKDLFCKIVGPTQSLPLMRASPVLALQSTKVGLFPPRGLSRAAVFPSDPI